MRQARNCSFASTWAALPLLLAAVILTSGCTSSAGSGPPSASAPKDLSNPALCLDSNGNFMPGCTITSRPATSAVAYSINDVLQRGTFEQWRFTAPGNVQFRNVTVTFTGSALITAYNFATGNEDMLFACTLNAVEQQKQLPSLQDQQIGNDNRVVLRIYDCGGYTRQVQNLTVLGAP